jgi:hypothetical protein
MSALSDRPAAATGWWPALEGRGERALRALEDERVCWAVLGVGMAIYAVLVIWLTRGTTLFVDGIDLFRNNRGLDAGALLHPLNGHLVLFERSVYAAGFALFPGNYVVFRLVEVAGACLAVVALFALVRRRIGPAAALAPALLLLFLGSAWEVTIVPDVMTNTFCVAAGLGAFLALDRGDRRGDLLACVLLAIAISCWTLGVAFAIGAAVLVALRPGWRRRLWVVAIPLALYVAWLVWVRFWFVPAHGEAQNLSVANVLLIPNYLADEAAAVVGAATGLNYDFQATDALRSFQTSLDYGVIVAVAAVVAIVYAVRRRGAGPVLWAAGAALLVFWLTLALAFGLGRAPTTIRYVYPGVALGCLIAAEALRGVGVSRRGLVLLYAAAALALGANVYRLQEGAAFFRDYSATQRAQMTAIELARGRVSPTFSTKSFFAEIGAGPYFAALDRNGSPAFTVADLAGQPEGVRATADSTLVAALRIGLAPPPPGGRPQGCRRLTAGDGAPAQFAAGPPGALIRTGGAAAVSLRRFASATTVPLGNTSPGKLVELEIPPDRDRSPWQVSVAAGGEPVTVCRPSG